MICCYCLYSVIKLLFYQITFKVKKRIAWIWLGISSFIFVKLWLDFSWNVLEEYLFFPWFESYSFALKILVTFTMAMILELFVNANKYIPNFNFFF